MANLATCDLCNEAEANKCQGLHPDKNKKLTLTQDLKIYKLFQMAFLFQTVF